MTKEREDALYALAHAILSDYVITQTQARELLAYMAEMELTIKELKKNANS